MQNLKKNDKKIWKSRLLFVYLIYIKRESMILPKKKTKTIEIDLSGPDGNAFVLMGIAQRLGKQMGWDSGKCQDLVNEMMGGDYEHLLQVFDREFGELVTLYR